MAASDYVPISFKNRLHLAGRPQMSTRPRKSICTLTAYSLCTGEGVRPFTIQLGA
jgi:hypothetical protein